MSKDNKKDKSIHELQESQIPYTPDESIYVRRTHKDKLFRFIFRDKRKLLQLYNAINGTSYEDVEGLIINTLENVIYLGYKNDISFLLDWALCLMEHQSTWNPNIPLRGMLYFARLYRNYIETMDLNLYGTKQIELPFPQFVVFYNGTTEKPERQVLCLSDAFRKPDNLSGELASPALECRAVILNINYGKNQRLMEKCKPLLDYSRFIYYIRENISKGHSPQKAVELAVDRCLEENILVDVLKEHRKEVVSMFLDEYDDELFTKRMYENIAKESAEAGRKAGMEAGQKAINTLATCLLDDKRQDELMRSFTDSALQKKLLREYHLLED
ncbi:MAG: hypothetical protein Q4C91_10795 [Eubacteriales bacterium]|nr:hypothetical protein [Eubacteriales bacterium]